MADSGAWVRPLDWATASPASACSPTTAVVRIIPALVSSRAVVFMRRSSCKLTAVVFEEEIGRGCWATPRQPRARISDLKVESQR